MLPELLLLSTGSTGPKVGLSVGSGRPGFYPSEALNRPDPGRKISYYDLPGSRFFDPGRPGREPYPKVQTTKLTKE